MIKINELRTGNIINYQTAEGDVLPVKIDWQDLKWLDEDAKGFNLVHSRIEITRDLMLLMRFYEEFRGDHSIFEKDGIKIYMDGNGAFECMTDLRYQVQFLHEVQNIYFAITGKEVKITPEMVNQKPEQELVDDMNDDLPF